MEECDTARQATIDIIVWRMRFASWVTRSTDTNSQRVIDIAFPLKMVTLTGLSVTLFLY